MSNKTKNVQKNVTKDEVKSIVKTAIVNPAITNKEAYTTCNSKITEACKLIAETIAISKKDNNIIPSSVVARFVHLLGKVSGSNNEQFVVGYERIVKKEAKAKAKVLKDAESLKKKEEKILADAEKLKALKAKIESLQAKVIATK